MRQFVEQEIYPHEAEVDRLGYVPEEIGIEITKKCQQLGFFGCNFPQEAGGAGLNEFDFTLVERELGRGAYALALSCAAVRPAFLMACNDEQREKYLLRNIWRKI